MSTLKPKIRIEFEKTISAINPNDLLKQRLITKDMGFYQRTLSHKIVERIDINSITDNDTLIVRYGIDGNRQVDVSQLNPAIAGVIGALAEGIFPSNYKNANK